MANGDDGYVDTGGGGSVWWKLRVSEGDQFSAEEHLNDDSGRNHRSRKPGTATFVLSGHDTFAKEGQPAAAGGDYFVVTIPDASQLRAVSSGDTLRLFLPIIDAPPSGMPPDEQDIQHGDGRVPQIRVRWGVRQLVGGTVAWAQLKAALTRSIGV